MTEKKNVVYIVKCSDNTYYTGWTNNLEKRLREHNQGVQGAKYTRGRRPVSLVYCETFATKEEAMSREWHIKQLTRAQKEKLISDKKSIRYDKISCDGKEHEV